MRVLLGMGHCRRSARPCISLTLSPRRPSSSSPVISGPCGAPAADGEGPGTGASGHLLIRHPGCRPHLCQHTAPVRSRAPEPREDRRRVQVRECIHCHVGSYAASPDAHEKTALQACSGYVKWKPSFFSPLPPNFYTLSLILGLPQSPHLQAAGSSHACREEVHF